MAKEGEIKEKLKAILKDVLQLSEKPMLKGEDKTKLKAIQTEISMFVNELEECEECGVLTASPALLTINGVRVRLCPACAITVLKRRFGEVEEKLSEKKVEEKKPLKEKEKLLRKERIISYYARRDVRKAMYNYAKGRKVTWMDHFSSGFELKSPEDIMLRMGYYLKKGEKWLSIHGKTSRKTPRSNRAVWDLVIEPDHRNNWRIAFQAVQPLVQLFSKMGITFFIKYSGHISPHIIIPGEVLSTISTGKEAYRAVYEFIEGNMKRPDLLDMSFLEHKGHFLRLPYSLHEKTGRASVPILPQQYDSFSPTMAEIENVQVIEDWWHIPKDAAKQGKEFEKRISFG